MATIEPLVRTDPKAVEKTDPLRSVVGWLQGASARPPVVCDDGRPVGIPSDRALMGRRLDDRAKLDGFLLPLKPLPATATLEEAAARMAESRARYLPVEDKRGKLAGYVTALDVARALANERTAGELCVPVTPLRGDQNMGEALHAFRQEYVDFLPVVDGDARLSSVLSRRSLLELELNGWSKGRNDQIGEKNHPLRDTVAGFADGAPFVLPAAASFHEVVRTVEKAGYAIVQRPDGALLGVATPETILRAGVGERP